MKKWMWIVPVAVLLLAAVVVMAGWTGKTTEKTVGDLTMQVPAILKVVDREDGFRAFVNGGTTEGIQVITGAADAPLAMTSEEYADHTGSDGATLGDQLLRGMQAVRGESFTAIANERITVGGVPAVHVRYAYAVEGVGTIIQDATQMLVKGIIYEITCSWTDATEPSVVEAMEQAVAGISFR